MGVLDKFAENFIARYPEFSVWLMFVVVAVLFIAAPIALFLLFSEKYNKGRYIFEKKGHGGAGGANYEMLYMLDTMKGKLYSVDGNARYKRMHEQDWKKDREDIDKNESK